jgi:predicted nucleic acid-binding protein
LKALGDFLRRHRIVALDTNVFIYHLDDVPRYSELTRAIFEWVATPGNAAVTSTITLTELLVQPYAASDQEGVSTYYARLVTYPNLSWVPPGLEIADRAAQIRAQHRLRTPDALQAATALEAGATALITNDLTFQRLAGIEVALLDAFIKPR